MAAIPGYSIEQKVETVANNDTDINAALTTANSDNWTAAYMILSGTDVIILFTRSVAS